MATKVWHVGLAIGCLVAVAPTPGWADYAATVAGDAPSLYYRLGESAGPTAVDSGSTGSNATYSASGVTYNHTGLIAGDANRAISVVEGGGVTGSATAQTAAYTIEGWFQPSGTSNPGTLAPRSLVVRLNSSGLYVQELAVQNFGTYAAFQHRFITNSAIEYVVTGTTVVTAGTTYHVVGTASNGGFARLYVNGVEEGTAQAIGTADTGVNWQLGITGGRGWNSFAGVIDEVAIYPRELTAAQIQQHYTAGTVSATPTPTSIGTPAITPTPTVTIPPTATFTQTATPTVTLSPMPTATGATATSTVGPSPTATNTSGTCGTGNFALRHVDSTTIEIALSWAPQAGATQYLVQRSTTPSFSSYTSYTVSNAENAYGDTGKAPTDRLRFYAPSSLLPGTTYYYRVVADMPTGSDPVSDCISAQLATGPQRGRSGDLWADVVIGQPDFGQNTFAKTTAAVMQWPGGVAIGAAPPGGSSKLYIADMNNNRIIGFDHIGQCGPAVGTDVALGRPYTLSIAPSPSYPDTGTEFTDGQDAHQVSVGDSFAYPGFTGPLDIVVDLGSAQPINVATLNNGAWTPSYTAGRLEIYTSNSSTSFATIPDGSADNLPLTNIQDPERLYSLSVAFPTVTARYVKFRVLGRVPAGWLFVGEGRVGLMSTAALQAATDRTNCTTDQDCPDEAICLPDAGVQVATVLGQPNVVDASACNGDGTGQVNPQRAPASASSLCLISPTQISIGETISSSLLDVDANGAVYVPDIFNNRVVEYDDPFGTDAVADHVWGQADFSGNLCNRGSSSVSCQSLCFDTQGAVALDGAGNLWVADSGNVRVLRFPKVGGVIQSTADVVLGQPSCSSKTRAGSPRPLNQMVYPLDVAFDSATGRLYVADAGRDGNARVLEFVPDPVLGFYTGMNAARALPVTFSCNLTGWITQPRELYLDSVTHSLWVGNDCFYIDRFNLDSSSLDKLSTVGASHCTGSAVDADGNLLALNQWAGNTGQLFRITRKHLSAPQAEQNTFAQQVFPKTRAGIGPDDLRFGNGVTPFGNQLIAADGHRLLIWNNFDVATATSHMPADDELGEVDLYTATFTQGWAFPQVFGSELWVMHGVSGSNAEDIQVFTGPLTNCMGGGCAPGRTIPLTASGSFTGYPVVGYASVAVAAAVANEIDFAVRQGGDELWVADKWDSRVFRIVNLKGLRDPQTGPFVDVILGQSSPTATACNGHDLAPQANTLCNPGYVTLDANGNVFVSDNGGESGSTQRMLEFDASLFPSTTPASAVIGPNASRVYGTGGSFTVWGLSATRDPRLSPFKPAFSPQGYLLVPNNPYATDRYPFVFTAPLADTLPQLALGDYSGYPAGNPSFDADGNLYFYDSDWSRVLIYKTPFEQLTFPNPPPTATRTITPTQTATQPPTLTGTPTATPTLTNTPTRTLTFTPTSLTPSATSSPTATPTITPTASPITQYFSMIMNAAPAGYWRLGEPPGVTPVPTVKDETANHNNGTYLNGPTLGVPGALSNDPNTAVNFAGSSDYVEIPDASSLRLTGSFAIELWMKLDALGQNSKYVIAKGNRYAVLFGYVTNSFEFFTGSGLFTGCDPRPGSQMAVQDTNWHHVVYSYDSTTPTWSGYLDGVQKFSTTSCSFTLSTGNEVFRIGAAGGNVNNINAVIDEVAVYGHPLTAAQVLIHYTMGTSAPAATPTMTGTATLTPTWTQTLTPTLTPTVTAVNTATLTPTATDSPTPTPTQTATTTWTETVTPTRTPTMTPSDTATATPTELPSGVPTYTASLTPAATDTPTLTLTATVTPTWTETVTPTVTPTVTASDTATVTPTPPPSAIPSSVPTSTASATPTATIECPDAGRLDDPVLRVSKILDPAGDESLTLQGDLYLISQAQSADPFANGFHFSIRDQNGAEIFSRTVPPGAPTSTGAAGWTVNSGGTRWVFRDWKGTVASGVTKVVVSHPLRTPLLYRFMVRGKLGDFQVTPAQVPVRIFVVLGGPVQAGAGQCGTRAFNPAGGARPACAFAAGGGVLRCR